MNRPRAAECEHGRLLRAAAAYRARGWVTIPVRGKRPCLRGWSAGTLTPAELERELLRPGRGIGLLLGEGSGGLVDVDLDRDEALDLAPAILPATPLVHGRAGRPWSHWWYLSVDAQNLAFRGPPGVGMIVELRASGQQTCVPPSRHPSGEALRWESWGPPATVPATNLRDHVGRLAVAAYLRSRGWPIARAVRFVREPDGATLDRFEAQPRSPPLRSWLGLPTPAGRTPTHRSAGPDRDTPSPYTAAILSQTDVVAAARLVGLALQDHKQQPCPFHDDAHASFQISGDLWRCHAGCGSGNAIHLVALALRSDYRTARNWLAGHLGIDWRDFWKPTPRPTGPLPYPAPPPEAVQTTIPPHP